MRRTTTQSTRERVSGRRDRAKTVVTFVKLRGGRSLAGTVGVRDAALLWGKKEVRCRRNLSRRIPPQQPFLCSRIHLYTPATFGVGGTYCTRTCCTRCRWFRGET